jgi:hypothetical protein
LSKFAIDKSRWICYNGKPAHEERAPGDFITFAAFCQVFFYKKIREQKKKFSSTL